MHRVQFHYSIIAAALIALTVGCSSDGHYRLVITNAKIWTNDSGHPAATILAVGRDGRVAFVGEQLPPDLRADQTVDARGARVLPGLIDAHLHLVSGGLGLSRIQLRNVADRAAFVAAVAGRAKKTPKGQWILGGRWSTESWADPAQPTKEWIDGVTPENPALLSRMDGHGALANSMALKLAGIDRSGPPDPPGGAIERDARTHEPTGILKDTAIDLVEKVILQPSEAELADGLKAAMAEANQHGLTCVDTMSSWRDIEAIRRARDAHQLTLRVRAFVQEDDWKPYLDRAKHFPNDDWVRVIGFKQYADGSLGSRTAYMAAPFSDNSSGKSDWRGLHRECLELNPANDELPLAVTARTATRNGLGVATHAIGDQANHLVLNAYEGSKVGLLTHHTLLRIEHAQHLIRDDIPRFAKIGVVVSMQPLHKADDGRYAEKAIGPERCKTSYAFRSLLDAGAHVAFGSDWPVVSLDPFLGIHAAVTGETLDGKVFVPEQNITVEEALNCYTSGAAYASGDDGVLGIIRVGAPADFVICSADPLGVPAAELSHIKVMQTYVAGRQVYPETGHSP